MGIDILQTHIESTEERIERRRNELLRTYPSDHGLMIPEIMVLYYARSFRTDTHFFQSFWKYDYALDNVRAVLDMLTERGFIFVGSAVDGINSYKVSELKSILEQFGLKKSGNKNELILRIVQNIHENELEKIISSKPYGLTSLGIEELESNQYIPFFHQTHCEFNPQINVRWLNRELNKHPEFREHWQDLIWGELNRQTQDAILEMANGHFYDYIQSKKVKAQFMMYRKEYYTALSLITEALYYHLNKREPKYILRDYQYYVVEKHEEMPENKWVISPFLAIFSEIQNEIGLSNEEFAGAIRFNARISAVPDEIIPINLISAWVLAGIMKNKEQMKFLTTKYQNAVIRKSGVHNGQR